MPDPSVSSSKPIRLLLVEDSFAVARELQALLRGVEGDALVFEHVETLGQALKLLGRGRARFDCLLVSLRLSDAEGLVAVRRLRTSEPHAAIVVLAAPDDRALALESLRLGAQDVLVNPWLRTADVAQDLQRLIRGAMDSRRSNASRPAEASTQGAAADAVVASSVFTRDEESAFDLRFQPWARTVDGSIHGIEVMLGSRAAQVSPRELLSAAESRGELDALSRWLLRRVAPLWIEWRRLGIAPPRLALNVAPSELHARNFAASRLALIDELGLPPRDLQIELAEDALIGAAVKAHGELQALRDAGVRVIADNVGRSQVALLALGRLPLDGVKLDIALIQSIRLQERASRAAVRGIVGFCEELGIQCCAVGVEVEPDATVCRELGVPYIQGYWLARPQTSKAMGEWLMRWLPPAPRATPEAPLASV